MATIILLQVAPERSRATEPRVHQLQPVADLLLREGHEVVHLAVTKLTLTQIRNEIDHADLVCFVGKHDSYSTLHTYAEQQSVAICDVDDGECADTVSIKQTIVWLL